MPWFSIGFGLLFPALLIVVTYLLIRIAIASRGAQKALEQTNQKLERVVAELRMARLRQLGEAPAEPSADPLQLKTPAEPAAAAPKVTAAGTSTTPAVSTPVASLKPDIPAPVVAQKPKPPPPPPAEVFAPDVKCYYCGRGQPLTRYLGQPICADCQKNALLKDETATR